MLIFRKIFILCFVCSCLFYGPDHAFGQGSSSNKFSGLIQTKGGGVRAIIDPSTIQLKDSRIISIVGLDMPYALHPPEPEMVDTALKILNDFLVGQDVLLFQTPKEDTSRYNLLGHHKAHIVRKDTNTWLQGLMLELGLARVRTTPDMPQMAKEMYVLEEKARKEGKGIWSDPKYAVLSPDQTDIKFNTFHIFEGVIQSTAIRNNRIYLNFGSNWRDDFTVSIPPQARKNFSKSKNNPLEWNNRKIRVRGWTREYNGAFMEIDHIERIEFLDGGS